MLDYFKKQLSVMVATMLVWLSMFQTAYAEVPTYITEAFTNLDTDVDTLLPIIGGLVIVVAVGFAIITMARRGIKYATGR